jgi:2-haloacid dehalogenase
MFPSAPAKRDGFRVDFGRSMCVDGCIPTRFGKGMKPDYCAGVIFDLGGVVIDWNPMYLYRKIFAGDEAKAADFLARICPYDWNVKQDAGRSLAEATEERVALFPEWENEIRAYYGRWMEMIGGPVPGTADVVRELKALGIRVFALSNWSRETFQKIVHSYGELASFEEILLSADYGCVKPEERIYRIALERFGMPVEELVFVDDSPLNVRGAEAVGLRALTFTGAEQLRRDLVRLGISLKSHA